MIWRVLALIALLVAPAYAGTPKEDRAARLMLLERQRAVVKQATEKASRAHDAWLNRGYIGLLPKEMKASSLRSGKEDWFGSLDAISGAQEKLYGAPIDFHRDPNGPERGQTFSKIKALADRIDAELRTINDDIMKDP